MDSDIDKNHRIQRGIFLLAEILVNTINLIILPKGKKYYCLSSLESPRKTSIALLFSDVL